MDPISVNYDGAGVSVRDDLRATHIEMLEYLRGPGTWFTGADRIADATGIPLDEGLAAVSGDVQRAVGVGRFASARPTRPGQPLSSFSMPSLALFRAVSRA